MIQDDKYHGALKALNLVLTRARFIALEEGNKKLSRLLDMAEILPTWISDEEDQTDNYKMMLEELGELFPICSHAAVLFDESNAD